MIRLTITKSVENKQFLEEMKVFQESQMRGNGGYSKGQTIEMVPEPRKEIIEDMMDVCVTDQQWEVIRKAVIQNF